MKKISCICTILILAAVMTVVSTEVFSADAASEKVELVGVMPGACSAVTVDGNKAYIGAGVCLLILDITNKSAPAFLGSVHFPNFVKDVDVEGFYAYIVDGRGGLRVVDVSEPTSPEEVGFYDTPGYVETVVVEGGYAYIPTESNPDRGLYIIDVSEPASPNEVAFYNTPGPARAVVVADGYAYIAADDIHIVDVSNPVFPREVGFYDTPVSAYAVAVEGGYAYIPDYNGLCIIDVSEPASPKKVDYHDHMYGIDAFEDGYAYRRMDCIFTKNDVESKEQKGEKPPLSGVRISGEIFVGELLGITGGAVACFGLWGMLYGSSISPDTGDLIWVIGTLTGNVLGSAIGVYCVGNIGNETGSFGATLGGSILGGIVGIAVASAATTHIDDLGFPSIFLPIPGIRQISALIHPKQ